MFLFVETRLEYKNSKKIVAGLIQVNNFIGY